MKKTLLSFSIVLFTIASQAQVNLTNGLIAYYPFSGNFADSSGNGNNGGVLGGVTLTNDEAGNANSAALFNGSGYINIPLSTELTVTTHFSAAFQFEAFDSSVHCLLSKSDYSGASANMQYKVGFDDYPALSGSGLFFATAHANCQATSFSGNDYAVTGNAIRPNQWYYVVMTFDSGMKNIYVNGVLQATDTIATTAASPYSIDSCSMGNVRIGAFTQQNPQYFRGILDNVRLYNRALTVDEITALDNPANTGVAIVNNDQQVALYPNPAVSQLTVALSRATRADVTIFNELGQQVITQKIDGISAAINIARLPAGIYLVQVKGSSLNAVKRFVKK